MEKTITGEYVLAFQDGEHRMLRDGEVSWDDSSITYVGSRRNTGSAPIGEYPGHLVMPGLIDTHFHTGTLAGQRLIPDIGRKEYFQSGYLNVWAVPRDRRGAGQVEDPVVGGRYALLELLRGGVTTAVEVGGGSTQLAGVAREIGIRAYLGRGYASGRHVLNAAGNVETDWSGDGGMGALSSAREFLEQISDMRCDRIRGMLFPSSPDVCAPQLLERTAEIAEELDVGLQIHVAQNLVEFHEMLHTHSMTPVEYLAATGILGPRTILGHCILTTAHPFAHMPEGDDIGLISASAASVSHCPLVFARRGLLLHSFSSYRRAGINLTLGTDAYPRDMLSEMRLAGLLSKIADASYLSGTAREVVDAATLGGAAALGRGDLGRLETGARADVIAVNLNSLRVGPFRDPIQALVNCAVCDDVALVVVDGQVLFRDGMFARSDASAVSEQAREFADDAWRRLPEWHIGKPVDEYAPAAYSDFIVRPS